MEYDEDNDLYSGLIETQEDGYYYVKMGSQMACFYKIVLTSTGAQPYKYFYFWANVNGDETISIVDYDTNDLITNCTLYSNCGHNDKEAFDSIRSVGKMLVDNMDMYLKPIK